MEDKNNITISVIVPSLNETVDLHHCIGHLIERNDIDEIVIVDSSRSQSVRDFYQQHIASMAKCSDRLITVASISSGRSLQMNLGAAISSKNILLFLHADTRLPNCDLRSYLANKSFIEGWGFFKIQLDGTGVWRIVVQTFMTLRARFTHIATGDMTLFMSRHMWNQNGCFAQIPLMEDIELSSRLRKLSPPCIISEPVVTSSRRWRQHGIMKTIFHMWKLRLWFWWGVPAQRLARLYQGDN